MSHRFNGNAAIPAKINDDTILDQKRGSDNPASIAPGITSMIPLSIISITAIDKVSEAKTSLRAE